MNLELNLFGGVIALAWALALPIDALFSILIALLVFCSQSVSVSLLLLLLLNLVAFIQATLGGKKSANGITQKRYYLSFFGIFVSLFGVSLGNVPAAFPTLFAGLLISMTSGVTLIFFSRHFEQITLKAYLRSSVIPTLVAIDVLLKIKGEMKAEFAELWSIGLMSVGLFSFIYSSLLALMRDRLKPMIIYLTQAWIGLLLFLCAIDAENLNRLSFASISIFCITSAVLLNTAWQLGDRFYSFAKIAFLGLPGMIGLTALFFAIRMTIGLNIIWLVLLGFGYLLNAITLIRSEPGTVQVGRNVRIRFWLVTVVQLVSGIGLYWFEKGGMK